MKDKLSYKQLYNELEALNASIFDSLLNEDFEEFQNTINEFTDSGIMEQEEFATAREAYRFASMPFTFDGIWLGMDSRNPLDRLVKDIAGPSIQELHERDAMSFYAYMVQRAGQPEIPKTESEDNRIASKRFDAEQQYIKLYRNLYNVPSPKGQWTIPLVEDTEKLKMVYVGRITELAAVRSKFYTTYDFTNLSLNSTKMIDNEKLKNMKASEKIQYLTEIFDNIYDPAKNKNKFKNTALFSFKSYEKVLISNYLQGKDIDRKNWKRYKKGILPAIPEFYLQLAFYLTIPSSTEIEKFMNLHGYSIKGPITRFGGIKDGNITRPVLHKDLCRWIDAGIDYNLINEICGLELQKKEIRKK